MEQSEHIIESELVTGQAKCSLFGSPQFVYFYLNYTSKANWLTSTDTEYFDPTCKCYQKDLFKLFPNEIEQAKTLILQRIRLQHTRDKLVNKNNSKQVYTPLEHKPINLIKPKNIKIKDIDWRD
jgi:hypothetical protein